MATHSFPVPTSILQPRKVKPGKDIYQIHLYVCQIILMRFHWQISKWPKLARKALSIRASGTQYVAMVTKLLSSYITTKNQTYLIQIGLDISYFIFDQNLLEFMTLSFCLFAYFTNLNISGKKRDI